MVTVEQLKEAQSKYQNMSTYYSNISFPHLSECFREMATLCGEMITTLTENNNQNDEVKKETV